MISFLSSAIRAVGKARTYLILALAAVADTLINADPDSDLFLLICGTVTIITFWAVRELGDMHKIYNLTLLVCALLTYCVVQLGILLNSDILINVFYETIIIITMLQLLGGVYGGFCRVLAGLGDFNSARVFCGAGWFAAIQRFQR
jgi:hypothetical protein